MANTRPHQLRCGDWEMRTAISCTKRVSLIHTVGWLHVATVTNMLRNFVVTDHNDHTQGDSRYAKMWFTDWTYSANHCYNTNLETKNKFSISVKPLQKRTHHHSHDHPSTLPPINLTTHQPYHPSTLPPINLTTHQHYHPSTLPPINLTT